MPALQGGQSVAKTTGKKAAPNKTGTDYTALLRMGLAPPDYTGLAQQASQIAGQQVGAQVAGIRAQQAQIRQSAAAQAGMTNDAAAAAAKYLQSLNLGGAVAGDYANAASAQRAGAAGYSGGLQQTVGDEAYRVQQNLGGLGSSQQINPQAQAAGNVLYGLGGNLPAQALDAQGPLQAAQARALPAQTLGYGQAQATAVLGAGRAEAGKLDPDVIAAQAQQATLTAQYLATLEKAARDTGQDRVANTLKVLGLQQKDEAARASEAYHTSVLAETSRAHTLTYNASVNSLNAANSRNDADNAAAAARAQASIAAANARSAASIAGSNARANLSSSTQLAVANARNAPHFSSSTSRALGYQADQYGQPIGLVKGKPALLPGFKFNANGSIAKAKTSTAAAKPGGLSQKDWNRAYASLIGDADDWYHGVPQVTNTRGEVTTPQQDPLTYDAALARVLTMYPKITLAKAKQILNIYWQPGEGGRPGRGSEAVAASPDWASHLTGYGGT